MNAKSCWLLSAETVRKFLSYNPETGMFTRRTNTYGAKAGDVAGHVTKRGYIEIDVGGCRCLGHRLAWLYVYGEWPKSQIDHKDRNTSNNAIKNLRPATPSQNAFNTKKRAGTGTPLKGAHWCKRTNCWRPSIKVDGRTIYLGRFETAQEAHAAYLGAAIKYRGEFARAA